MKKFTEIYEDTMNEANQAEKLFNQLIDHASEDEKGILASSTIDAANEILDMVKEEGLVKEFLKIYMDWYKNDLKDIDAKMQKFVDAEVKYVKKRLK